MPRIFPSDMAISIILKFKALLRKNVKGRRRLRVAATATPLCEQAPRLKKKT